MPKTSSFPSQLTTEELCKLIGVTRTHIARLEKDGVVEKLAPGRYSVTSVPRYIASLRARGNMTGRYGEARCRKMEEQALLAEMNRKAREGELVSVADIMIGLDVSYQACRTRLLAIPHGLTPRLNGPANRPKDFELMTDAIYEALDEISRFEFVAKRTDEAAE
jgi:hypothetical protein